MAIFFDPRGNWKKILGVVLVVLALVVAQPYAWRAVRRGAESLRDRQTREDQLANIKVQIEEINNEMKAQEGLIESLNISFPSQGDAPEIIERLESLADVVGVRLVVESIDEEASRKAILTPLIVTMKVAGTPETLLVFMSQLEHIQELFDVRAWTIQPVGASAGFEMTMSLRVYLQPQDDG